MGILFKLLCPGDLPSKAHKLFLNSTTSVLYEHICLEEHHVAVSYDPWALQRPILYNTTNELIQYPVNIIWEEYDRVPWDWEILLRELLLNNCIKYTKLKAIMHAYYNLSNSLSIFFLDLF